MKIKYSTWSGKIVDVSIADAVEGSVTSGDYSGHIENIEGHLSDVTKLVGKLVEALHTNRKLTDEQLKSMISWKYQIEE